MFHCEMSFYTCIYCMYITSVIYKLYLSRTLFTLLVNMLELPCPSTRQGVS